MAMNSLKDLFAAQLHLLYDAELQLIAAMPKIIIRASTEALKAELEKHLVETHIHVTRLELIATEMRIRNLGRESKGMKGILEEADDLLAPKSAPEILDAAIIAVCERIENYEIAGYGTALAFSEVIGNEISTKYLHQTLCEERSAGRIFVNIGAASVNEAADDVASY